MKYLNRGGGVMDNFFQLYNDSNLFFSQVVSFLLFLIATLIIGKVVVMLLLRILKLVQFEIFAEKIGFNEFLTRGAITLSPLDLVNTVLSWIVVIIASLLSLKFIGIAVADNLINTLLAYVGNILIAFIIIVVGVVMADFVKGIIKVSAGNAKLANGDILAFLGKSLVLIFTFALALEHLKISVSLIQMITFTIFGSIGLGLAIAIGLGAKEKVAELINDIFKKN
jgi:hypothetical protein